MGSSLGSLEARVLDILARRRSVGGLRLQLGQELGSLWLDVD